MTPVDPLLHNYGPRRALTTSTLERPLRPLRTGPRPEALAIQDRPSERKLILASVIYHLTIIANIGAVLFPDARRGCHAANANTAPVLYSIILI
jgi:hypothetical protein